jgi:hypothetical protein
MRDVTTDVTLGPFHVSSGRARLGGAARAGDGRTLALIPRGTGVCEIARES